MVSLSEKFAGCIAASWVGSAMGAAVEGWSPERIEQTHGHLDRLLPYCHYAGRTETRWERPPGTTEDGIERQRLLATAIIEKQDRILARDLVAVWLRDLDPARSAYKQEDYDRALLEFARAGAPPELLGSMRGVVDNVGPARASHSIGLINAGDPRSAADDAYEFGQVYLTRTSVALRWAALYCAAIAAACRPEATVESVVRTAQEFADYRGAQGQVFSSYDRVAKELDRALEIAGRSQDVGAMRDEFCRIYTGGSYIVYGGSQANEVVAKGIAVFAFTRGNPKDAILTAVNFGRDTDCLAAIAGGLAGALSGTESLPPDWLKQVDEATQQDPYTNCRRTIADTAEGLYGAFRARLAKLADYVDTMSDA
ncbi:MAG: ADP-ribosylglycohydrolase family protein [Candidatus Brocadiae bacterium]|nr:ADP-ribosylglycohydrolase family protein [Candidatus Brocadiia bacterium]